MKHKPKTKKDSIQNLKSATVAISLNSKVHPFLPVAILGSGFIADPSGIIVTAAHVYHECYKIRNKLRTEKNMETLPSAIISFPEKNKSDIYFSELGLSAHIMVGDAAKGTQKDIDVAVCMLKGVTKSLPFLEIEKPQNLNLLDDVFMCGYPGGASTFHISQNVMDAHLSPVIQSGKISSFIPDDLVRPAQGFITDIIGTGGSSGSPIVHRGNHNVVGLAQSVIPSSIFLSEALGEKKGITNIGLVSGVSSYILQGIPEVCEKMKKGDIKGLSIKTEYSHITKLEID